MYQITCPQCSNQTKFDSLEKRPIECSFCFTSFSADLPVQEIQGEAKGRLIGLKLICQQTAETLMIQGDHNLLGREHLGAQIFSKIWVNQKQVISRKHCSIKLVDGKYCLKDEGSTNGTFYGVSKIDCSKEAQVIENNSIIFLGREAFLVQFIFETKKEEDLQQTPTKQEESNKTRKFRCKEGCGFESETYVEICPKCMAINSMVEVKI